MELYERKYFTKEKIVESDKYKEIDSTQYWSWDISDICKDVYHKCIKNKTNYVVEVNGVDIYFKYRG